MGLYKNSGKIIIILLKENIKEQALIGRMVKKIPQLLSSIKIIKAKLKKEARSHI